AAASRSLVLEIENRFDSTDLSDVEASWTCGSAKGTVELAGAPGETVRVEIEHGEVAPGAPVEVEFRHRRSRRLIDLYRFSAGGAEDAVLPVRSRQVPFTSERRDGRWRAARGDWSYAFDR